MMSPWKCLLCDTHVSAQDIVTGSHLRVMHPDYGEDGPAMYWPDGGVVFLDDSVEDEFLDPQ